MYSTMAVDLEPSISTSGASFSPQRVQRTGTIARLETRYSPIGDREKQRAITHACIASDAIPATAKITYIGFGSSACVSITNKHRLGAVTTAPTFTTSSAISGARVGFTLREQCTMACTHQA
jgi:hypothetical protein